MSGAALDRLVEQGQTILQDARHAVALTGAGVSTASGIPDFRSAATGLWERTDPMEVATLTAFWRRPQAFYDWVRPLTRAILSAAPNAAHIALAQLEAHGPLQTLITQNIDDLHFRAGSRAVCEVHGHLRRATCIQCSDQVAAGDLLATFNRTGDAPKCPLCGGVYKPDVILFGEDLPGRIYQRALTAVRRCDVMLVAGSSLEVTPVNELPLIARQRGAHLIIVNDDSTHLDSLADLVIRADVVDVLPRLAAPFVP